MMLKVQVKTGSEQHSTEWRSAVVNVNGQPIWKVLTPQEPKEWELVGNKGAHGKWCTAVYCLSVGMKVEFLAMANGRPTIHHSFTVGEQNEAIDVDGYTYNRDICGWIVSL